MIFSESISIDTKGYCDIVDITPPLLSILKRSKLVNGLVTLFCPGSTGALTTIEYEPGALQDLKDALERIAPSNIPYRHDERWGDGNGFSHVRAALMKPSLTIPVVDGKLTLGTWQQVVFIDFDNCARHRDIIVQIMGD
ncbi:MAG TPA: secondary thiamine-phosphate synthase enzyme YjbQ [Smithellaceae bacterium]|nr:secondary thiamine-phosphate synthase enzyme YjbQ [Smithellaceae bacterium]